MIRKYWRPALLAAVMLAVLTVGSLIHMAKWNECRRVHPFWYCWVTAP